MKKIFQNVSPQCKYSKIVVSLKKEKKKKTTTTTKTFVKTLFKTFHRMFLKQYSIIDSSKCFYNIFETVQ